MSTYRERLWPSAWVYLATALIMPAVALALWPVEPVLAVSVALVVYGAVVAALIGASPVIEVSDSGVRAGRAFLDAEHVGEATPVDGAAATAERGVRLDARAWLLIRGWVQPVVRIAVVDPRDPAPYWLVSSRRPVELADAIERIRPRTPGR